MSSDDDAGFRFAILKGREVEPCDMRTWLHWAKLDRHIAHDTSVKTRLTYSTVFIGLSKPSDDPLSPPWFETLVLSPEGESIDGARATTWDQAMGCHFAMLSKHG